MPKVPELSPHEKNIIKGKIRQAFRQTERFKKTLDAARVELPPAIKKNGEPGKRPQVRFKCAACGNLFPGKWVSVDHIDPVVPLWIKEHDMAIQDVVYGIFCNEENLQVLCSTPLKFLPKGDRSCHSKKTNRENFIRDLFDKERNLQKAFTASDIDNIKMLQNKYASMYDGYLKEQLKKQEEKAAKKLLREAKKAEKTRTK